MNYVFSVVSSVEREVADILICYSTREDCPSVPSRNVAIHLKDLNLNQMRDLRDQLDSSIKHVETSGSAGQSPKGTLRNATPGEVRDAVLGGPMLHEVLYPTLAPSEVAEVIATEKIRTAVMAVLDEMTGRTP